MLLILIRYDMFMYHVNMDVYDNNTVVSHVYLIDKLLICSAACSKAK